MRQRSLQKLNQRVYSKETARTFRENTVNLKIITWEIELLTSTQPGKFYNSVLRAM